MEFAAIIRSKMEKKGWSIKKLADEIGRTPEHARKVCTGRAFPSDDLAERIAGKLDIDLSEFKDQLAADRWERKYKKKPPQTERPDLGSLEKLWTVLSNDQREYVLCVTTCLAMKKHKTLRTQ